MENLRIGNRQLIKDLNRSRVIEQIRNQGPLSRTDISKKTGLGLSTVTNIVESLQENELVFEVGAATSTGGRRPVLLKFNHDFGYTLGIKIEEQQLLIAATNLKADILKKDVVEFDSTQTASEVLQLLLSSIKKLIQEKALQPSNLLGIGIAVSGLVNSAGGRVIRSSLLGWENVDMQTTIERAFDVPVFIDNDVNAYTLAELWLGHGKTRNNFICVTTGTGIGSGIVIDRKLYYGQFGGAGEFGHMIIQVHGHLCHCGQRGCLDMYASEKYLKKEGAMLLNQFPDTILTEDSFTFEAMEDAAAKRDPLALELLKRTGEYLGVGLINIVNSLNPTTVIFAGEGMIAESYFLPYAIETARQNFFAKADCHTEFIRSELGNDAWLSGAALLAINHLFQVPIYEQNQTILS